jgi:hypothetical protein
VERFVIEQLQGANRNAVEGVTNAPEIVKNVQFKRAGGYIPLGGRRDDWLGERAFSKLLLETGDSLAPQDAVIDPITDEADIVFISNWQPTADLEISELLAQDDTTLALLSGPRVWFNNDLNTLTSPTLLEDTRLALAPKAAILSEWRRIDDFYVGGVGYVTPSNALTQGLGAGTVTITDTPTGSIPAADYEFVWVVESPTENGLVVHAVGYEVYTVAAGGAADIEFEFSEIYEEGTVIRLYYINDLEDPSGGMERIALGVSNGVSPVIILVDALGTFTPTNEVLLNFAPGRAEAHNGRMWGVAGQNAFVPFLPQGALARGGGYLSISSGVQSTVRQYGEVDAAEKGLITSGDKVEIDISEFYVRRTSRTLPIVVELFSNQDALDADKDLFGYLQWDVGVASPRLKVFFTADGVVQHVLCDELIPLSLLQLGIGLNQDLFTRSLNVRVTLNDVTDNGDGSITSDVSIRVAVGEPARVYLQDVVIVGSDTAAFADWGTYAAAGDTTLALGAVPATFLPQSTIGSRRLKVRFIRTLAANNAVLALGDVNDYDPVVDLTTWTSSSPAGETWNTVSFADMVVEYRGITPEVLTGPSINANLTVIYSAVGSVNRGTLDNFIVFTPLSSSRITALSSTPAGLIVFLENETFLIRGDPATQNLEVQRLSGTIGNDVNNIPARIGNVIFPIYQGEIYGVNLGGGDVDFGGGLANISQPVWKPDDSFVQVVGEPLRNHVVAVTNQGRVFRFDVVTQQWLNDVFDDFEGLEYVIGATVTRKFGVRYNIAGYLEVVDSDLVDAPLVKWADLDMGDKNLMKLWRRIEVYTNGSSGAPVLRWAARGLSGTVAGLDNGNGRWVFTLPRGVVSVKADLEFEFVGAGSAFTLEPPVVIEFAPRYRER